MIQSFSYLNKRLIRRHRVRQNKERVGRPRLNWARETLAELLGEARRLPEMEPLGLEFDENKKIIFYDNVSGMLAARGVWLCLYFSLSDVYILNGGLKKCLSNGTNMKSD